MYACRVHIIVPLELNMYLTPLAGSVAHHHLANLSVGDRG